MERTDKERRGIARPLAEELVGAAREVEVRIPECDGSVRNKCKKKKVIRHREGEVKSRRNRAVV